MSTVLDWSGMNGGPRAGLGPLKECTYCGRPSFLRHPVSKLPCHKVCAERAGETVGLIQAKGA